MITLQLIGITVVLVLALKIVMSEDMLLERLGEFFETKIAEGNKWPDLFYCQWCMGTLQAITAHFFAFGLGILPFEWHWQLLIRYPLIVGATSIIAGNLWNVYLMINQIRERNEAEASYYNSLHEPNNENKNYGKEEN